VLKEHKEAIGWTVADPKGIDPSICMHRIYLEGAKPSREAQCRLNPNMKEVVMKEIVKLLDDHLPHLRQQMDQPHSSSSKEVWPYSSRECS
jgi:hypothetical protein